MPGRTHTATTFCLLIHIPFDELKERKRTGFTSKRICVSPVKRGDAQLGNMRATARCSQQHVLVVVVLAVWLHCDCELEIF